MAIALEEMQVAEKAVIEIKNERTINWNDDPFGRAGQLQRLFWVLEGRKKEIVEEYNASCKSLQSVKEVSDKLVSDAAKDVYATLENVLHGLLQIEDGRTRLSRLDSSIIQALHATVDKFKALCSTTEHTTAEVALESERCMRLGDNANKFTEELAAHMHSLNIESASMWRVRDTETQGWNDALARRVGLQNNLNSAINERESFGTGFIGFFDSDVKDNAERLVRDASNNMNNNEDRIREKDRKATIFYQLTMMARNTSAAIQILKVEIEKIASEFDVDFRRVTDELKVANTLWKGLMDLKNTIWATDLYATRDSSLGVILNLLEADDDVFHREPFYEDTQVRIQDAICAKLGPDAIIRLKSPQPELIENGLSDL